MCTCVMYVSEQKAPMFLPKLKFLLCPSLQLLHYPCQVSLLANVNCWRAFRQLSKSQLRQWYQWKTPFGCQNCCYLYLDISFWYSGIVYVSSLWLLLGIIATPSCVFLDSCCHFPPTCPTHIPPTHLLLHCPEITAHLKKLLKVFKSSHQLHICKVGCIKANGYVTKHYSARKNVANSKQRG